MQSVKNTAISEEIRDAASHFVVIGDRHVAARLLADCISRYHRKESNYHELKKILSLLPDSFYAHSIQALYHVERKTISFIEKEFHAYDSLAKARSMMSADNVQEQELFLQVEAILHHETEVVHVHYEY